MEGDPAREPLVGRGASGPAASFPGGSCWLWLCQRGRAEPRVPESPCVQGRRESGMRFGAAVACLRAHLLGLRQQLGLPLLPLPLVAGSLSLWTPRPGVCSFPDGGPGHSRTPLSRWVGATSTEARLRLST